MVLAQFQNGPAAGSTVELPFAVPTVTMHVGSQTVEYELIGKGEGVHLYSAKRIVERVKTPKKSTTAAANVPAVKFTGG